MISSQSFLLHHVSHVYILATPMTTGVFQPTTDASMTYIKDREICLIVDVSCFIMYHMIMYWQDKEPLMFFRPRLMLLYFWRTRMNLEGQAVPLSTYIIPVSLLV